MLVENNLLTGLQSPAAAVGAGAVSTVAGTRNGIRPGSGGAVLEFHVCFWEIMGILHFKSLPSTENHV